MTPIYSERHDTPDGPVLIEIHYDETPFSPRENTNLTTIIGWSRDYNLSDDGQPSPRGMFEDYSPRDWWEGFAGLNDSDPENAPESIPLWFAPLMLADYGASGVRLSLGNPDSDDDWRRSAGVVFVTRDDWNACMGVDAPILDRAWFESESGVVGELDAYERYLNGDVYGFVVSSIETHHDAEGKPFTHRRVVDSVWGFYGEWDGEYGALTEGRHAAGVTADTAQEVKP